MHPNRNYVYWKPKPILYENKSWRNEQILLCSFDMIHFLGRFSLFPASCGVLRLFLDHSNRGARLCVKYCRYWFHKKNSGFIFLGFVFRDLFFGIYFFGIWKSRLKKWKKRFLVHSLWLFFLKTFLKTFWLFSDSCGFLRLFLNLSNRFSFLIVIV